MRFPPPYLPQSCLCFIVLTRASSRCSVHRNHLFGLYHLPNTTTNPYTNPNHYYVCNHYTYMHICMYVYNVWWLQRFFMYVGWLDTACALQRRSGWRSGCRTEKRGWYQYNEQGETWCRYLVVSTTVNYVYPVGWVDLSPSCHFSWALFCGWESPMGRSRNLLDSRPGQENNNNHLLI